MRQKIAINPYGFSLIELLIVLAVVGVILGMVASSFGNTRKRIDLEGAAHKVTQDLQTCRSLAISKSSLCRLRFAGQRYRIELSSDGSTWTTRRSFTLPDRITPSWTTGEAVLFDSRGFASFPTAPDPYQITLTDGTYTLIIVPTMTGAARVVKP